eukprot:3021530-Pyramimonas_sp.AAC.1
MLGKAQVLTLGAPRAQARRSTNDRGWKRNWILATSFRQRSRAQMPLSFKYVRSTLPVFQKRDSSLSWRRYLCPQRQFFVFRRCAISNYDHDGFFRRP